MVGKRKTVDGVMAVFTTAMADLDTVAENNKSIVQNLQVQQEALAAEMKAATEESDRAASIRGKLAELMG